MARFSSELPLRRGTLLSPPKSLFGASDIIIADTHKTRQYREAYALTSRLRDEAAASWAARREIALMYGLVRLRASNSRSSGPTFEGCNAAHSACVRGLTLVLSRAGGLQLHDRELPGPPFPPVRVSAPSTRWVTIHDMVHTEREIHHLHIAASDDGIDYGRSSFDFGKLARGIAEYLLLCHNLLSRACCAHIRVPELPQSMMRMKSDLDVSCRPPASSARVASCGRKPQL